jgi:hypothetical protein
MENNNLHLISLSYLPFFQREEVIAGAVGQKKKERKSAPALVLNRNRAQDLKT